MNIKSFLWDKILAIVFNIIGLIIIFIYISIIAGLTKAFLLVAIWLVIFLFYLNISYLLLKKRIFNMRKIAANVNDKFLLSEIIPPPLRSEDRLYYEFLLMQGKSAIEIVNKAEKEKADYHDYIEQWVHEIKTPISTINLICDNNEISNSNEIILQLNKINNYVEQVLYEAKSNNTEKDMLIKETDLLTVVNDCIKENKQLFISVNIEIDVDVEGIVYSDDKWVGFILKQVLFNAAQYSKEKNAKIKIFTRKLSEDKVELCIYDNGIGILESELPRIFAKGFTGSNGRRNYKSTGLGLYLCKKLCDTLAISLKVTSRVNEYTEASLVFCTVTYKTVI